MAVRLHSAAGWTITEENAYTEESSRWNGTSDGAGECSVTHTGFGQGIDVQVGAGYLADRWACGRDARVVDWGGSPGDRSTLVYISSLNAYIALEYVSAGAGFRVGLLYDTVYHMGNDVFAWSPTDYDWRVSTDGARIMLEYGSPVAEQVNRLHISKIEGGYLALAGAITDADLMYCKEIIACSGDSGSDRPDPATLDILKMVPITGTPHHDEVTTPGSNKYAEVDDWDSGDSDGNTTYTANPATVSTTFRQTFLTANQTLANIRGCMLFQRGAATVAAKDLWIEELSCDGVNDEELSRSLAGGTSYASRRSVIQLAPDGGPWTQADLDNWEIGYVWEVGADAVTWKCTAIQGEAVGFDLDAGEIPDRDWPLPIERGFLRGVQRGVLRGA